MAKSKVPASVYIIVLIAAVGALVYFGAKMMGGRQVLSAEVYVQDGVVVIVNTNDAVWPEGTAYSGNREFSVHFVDVQPGGSITMPLSEFNEFKDARTVKELPIREVYIRVDKFQRLSPYKIQRVVSD